jgi:hypothetical protein
MAIVYKDVYPPPELVQAEHHFNPHQTCRVLTMIDQILYKMLAHPFFRRKTDIFSPYWIENGLLAFLPGDFKVAFRQI